MKSKISHRYEIECIDSDGKRKWREEFGNLVTTVGKNDILNKYYAGSAYTAAHYVGLTAGTPTFAAADTMASHTGWTESTSYSESVRQTFTAGTASAGSLDNSASKASFSINATATIGGSFLTTDNTKSGTSGTLIGGAAFSANRSAVSGDTVIVTVTATLT